MVGGYDVAGMENREWRESRVVAGSVGKAVSVSVARRRRRLRLRLGLVGRAATSASVRGRLGAASAAEVERVQTLTAMEHARWRL